MARTSATSSGQWRVAEPARAGRDDLMSLPTAMLDNILGRLPLDDLVRTGRLSRAWRRHWQSVANLDIRFSEGSAAASNRFVLWRCAAPLRSFTARVRPSYFRSARWLLTLARKRVEKLVLYFDDRDVLGPALFSCRVLTHLELHGSFQIFGDCHLLRAPQGFGGFPNLVTLVLQNVVLPFRGGRAQLGHLVSSAPHLTVLSLDNVGTGLLYDTGSPGEKACFIQAPNLRVLKLIMPFDNGCRLREELPLLEEAAISIDDLSDTSHFIETFRRISTVKMLTFLTHIDKRNLLDGISWKFQNLRVAHLAVNFGKLPSIMSIFSLLRFGPCIEELEIEVDFISMLRRKVTLETSDDDIGEDNLEADISDDLFANLKHISLDGMKYLPNDRWFMKFVLSKTGSLESFDVTFDYLEVTESYEEACVELEMCQKASSQAKLTLKHRGEEPAPNLEGF
ncbi:unnamed protein product [Alopecurus aequalis]